MIQNQIFKIHRPEKYQRNIDSASQMTDNTENDDLINVPQMAETLFTLPAQKAQPAVE